MHQNLEAAVVMSENAKPKLDGRGGAGRGQGRKKGIPNRSTSELEKYMHKLLDKIVANKGDTPTALEMYQALYRDNKVPIAVRREAMNKALPYEAGKVVPQQPVDDPDKPKTYEHRINAARDSLKSKLVAAAQSPAGEPVAGDIDR